MMMQRMTRTRWSVVNIGACAALFASACGGTESPRTQTEKPSQTQAQTPVKAAEKAFVSGGTIDMQLDGGNYTVRPVADNAIRVTLGGNVGAAKVDVTTKETQANVSVKDTPHNNFQAIIEVPRTADVVIRLAAGDLKVEAITGNKDIESNAGNVDIVTGDSKDYARVDASVHAGDLKVGPFGESQSGLFRSFTWSGSGKYALRAKLTAGNLTLRSQ
jgi:hypothetical protein